MTIGDLQSRMGALVLANSTRVEMVRRESCLNELHVSRFYSCCSTDYRDSRPTAHQLHKFYFYGPPVGQWGDGRKRRPDGISPGRMPSLATEKYSRKHNLPVLVRMCLSFSMSGVLIYTHNL